MINLSHLTHFNEAGRARMVDISNKQESSRKAIAHSSIQMKRIVYENIINQKNKKGDVLAVAQIAGIMGAKQTSSLIPMCHQILITSVDLSFQWNELDNDDYELIIHAEVKTVGSTGVEMEALTAASISALTVYDMCKAIDKRMIIRQTYLLEKEGGKSGHFKS